MRTNGMQSEMKGMNFIWRPMTTKRLAGWKLRPPGPLYSARCGPFAQWAAPRAPRTTRRRSTPPCRCSTAIAGCTAPCSRPPSWLSRLPQTVWSSPFSPNASRSRCRPRWPPSPPSGRKVPSNSSLKSTRSCSILHLSVPSKPHCDQNNMGQVLERKPNAEDNGTQQTAKTKAKHV